MFVFFLFLFFFGYYIASKIWTIILTIGQHCHFLIFGFGIAQENGEDDPMYELELRVAHRLSVEAEKEREFGKG